MNDLKAEYTKIWNENVMSLRKCCLSKMQENSEEAEEIVTEVFDLLWKKMKTDGVPANANMWLYATLEKAMKEKPRTVKSPVFDELYEDGSVKNPNDTLTDGWLFIQ